MLENDKKDSVGKFVSITFSREDEVLIARLDSAQTLKRTVEKGIGHSINIDNHKGMDMIIVLYDQYGQALTASKRYIQPNTGKVYVNQRLLLDLRDLLQLTQDS